jgi:hypothetical protein
MPDGVLHRVIRRCMVAALTLVVVVGVTPPAAGAAVDNPRLGSAARPLPAEHGASSLEAAASKAGSIGRAVAMSLIGLAFAVAGTVLAFRRDFKEAAGVFAVGIVAILLASPAGMTLLRDTVAALFGSQ